MAQQTITNGETGLQVRTDLNDNFTELYGSIDTLNLTIEYSGSTNNEHLLTPMPDTGIPTGRNTINGAGLTNLSASTNVGAAATNSGNHICREGVPNNPAPGGLALFTTHYVDDDLSADPQVGVVSIHGAYDQVCNSTGSSCVTSPHGFIKYSVGGHNNLFGGSTLLMSGTTTRCVQLGGLTTVMHDSSFSVSLCNQDTAFDTASNSGAVGCDNATISTAHSFVVGVDSAITVEGTKVLVVGNNAGGAGAVNHAFIGAGNTGGGDNSTTVGTNNINNQNASLVVGDDGFSVTEKSLNISGQKITYQGDAQYTTICKGSTSTGSGITLSIVQWPVGVTSATGMLEITLIGTIVGTNSMIAYTNKLAFLITSTGNTYLDSAGTGANLYRDPQLDDSGLTWSGGTAGQIRHAGNAQWMRIVTPGFSDSETVKWVMTARLTFTREDDVTA